MSIIDLVIGHTVCYNDSRKGDNMPILYNRLFTLMKGRSISIYKLKSDKIIGTATLDKIRKGEGHIDTRSIESLCRYLDCQPGDIMEYVPDNETTNK